MFKRFALLMIAAFALISFNACEDEKENTYKDGTYSAEYEISDTYGWKGFVEIEIKSDKIVKCVFDYKQDSTNELKSKSLFYKENMDPDPEIWLVEYANKLIKTQNIEKVDAVSGATHSLDDFTILISAALENAKLGITDLKIIEVERQYMDGSYASEFANYDDHGWKAFMTLTIKDDKITTCYFDYKQEGTDALKSTSEYYKENMDPDPEVWLVEYANKLIAKQNIDNVDAVTGATHSLTDFQALAKAILDAAKTGDTSVQIVE